MFGGLGRVHTPLMVGDSYNNADLALTVRFMILGHGKVFADAFLYFRQASFEGPKYIQKNSLKVVVKSEKNRSMFCSRHINPNSALFSLSTNCHAAML